MNWKPRMTESQKYERHIKEATEALRTMDVDELKRWREDLKARLPKVEAGTAKPDSLVGDIEAPEIQRLIGRITERVTFLNRVAAGGTDPGREVAEKGTSPLHARLRDAYTELDRIESAEGNPTDVLRTIATLKKTIAEGRDLGPLATPDEVQERKRGERRYAGL